MLCVSKVAVPSVTTVCRRTIAPPDWDTSLTTSTMSRWMGHHGDTCKSNSAWQNFQIGYDDMWFVFFMVGNPLWSFQRDDNCDATAVTSKTAALNASPRFRCLCQVPPSDLSLMNFHEKSLICVNMSQRGSFVKPHFHSDWTMRRWFGAFLILSLASCGENLVMRSTFRSSNGLWYANRGAFNRVQLKFLAMCCPRW